jgi:hypothetical protein
MVKRSNKTAPVQSHATLVANIVGQFCFAFGQGAGSVHVMREAIQAIRERYEPFIEAATPDGSDALWIQQAIHVLEYMRAEGRLAAEYVIVDGRTKITRRDFLKAAEKVEAAARHDHRHGLTGVWCPP